MWAGIEREREGREEVVLVSVDPAANKLSVAQQLVLPGVRCVGREGKGSGSGVLGYGAMLIRVNPAANKLSMVQQLVLPGVRCVGRAGGLRGRGVLT